MIAGLGAFAWNERDFVKPNAQCPVRKALGIFYSFQLLFRKPRWTG